MQNYIILTGRGNGKSAISLHKMKKLVPMTNKEYVAKHRPDLIDNTVSGGVIGCPDTCFYLENTKKEYGCASIDENCIECWNLPAKIDGKYIMKVVEI